ncbi:YtxH domain-containing protein [Gleimia hominis]|uniref:YtxH domain-containing protein n=1 Tax=Gleimia hominis TaxID=595468 RepID=UPI001E51340F|nr:YtxH domain-containing protein [Gleimia hominis]WIK64302.1 YtxH domain-containing protein [Gleimia hominis]
MARKLSFILGAGIGYVLGTRAGRSRYESIKRHASKLRNSPTLAKPIDNASEKVSEALRRGGQAATDKIVSVVKERVFGVAPEPKPEYVDVDVVEVTEEPPADSAKTPGFESSEGFEGK